MKTTRRMKRMGRARRRDNKVATLSLVALMDMFTNLVFFLLVSQGATEIKEPRKEITLPDSYVEQKTRPSVVIMVSEKAVMVEGEALATVDQFLETKEDTVPAVRDRLTQIKGKVIGLNEQTKAQSDEVTILAHKTIPFKVLKKLMSTCASAGYSKISLAVNQKSPQT
ncbi:MAG: ExbD/TolR family protein [Sulfurifustaceae bacterium]